MEERIRGLYAIADNAFSPQYSHVELAHMFLLGGCRLIQLRMKSPVKGLFRQEIYETAKKIMELKRQFDFTFIVNDFVDVAGEVGADGVHVGRDDMPVSKVRKRVGRNLIVGYSSHSIEEASDAAARGADYVAFGAIFPTRAKGPGHPIQGVEKLRELVHTISTPIVAIGGIKRSNVDNVINTGASAVAMITGLTMARDVVEETRWYVARCK